MSEEQDIVALSYQVPNQLSRLSSLATKLCASIERVLTDLSVFSQPRDDFWTRWEAVKTDQMELAYCRFASGYPSGRAPAGFRINDLLARTAERTEFHGAVGVGEVDILNDLASEVRLLLPPLTDIAPYGSAAAYDGMRARMSGRSFPTQKQVRELSCLVELQIGRAVEVFRSWSPDLLTPAPKVEREKTVVEEAGALISPQLPTAHSPDFRSVHWYGYDFTFTEKQAAVVRILWGALGNRTPEVSQSYLQTDAGVDSPLRELFRNSPAWDTMIVEGSTKGTRRLREGMENVSRAKTHG